MAAPVGKFDAPSPGASVDQGKFLKLAQRVEQTLTKEVVYPEPKQLDPNLVLVSPLNRMGASPNVQHVHFGILKSFLKNSFDRTRPAIGICVEYRSEQGIKKLLEHNRRFTQGNKLLPQILEDHAGPFYGSLACTHLNLAFRAIKNGSPSPIGTLGDLMNNKTLKEVVLSGHRWWVLPESVPKENLMDISLWRNQDQNENQQSHELEVLQTIKVTASGFLSAGKTKVPLADLIAGAQKRNPAKISAGTWLVMAKFYFGFLENDVVDLVDDLSDFHSTYIDPRELSVSITFYQFLEHEGALKNCPQLRLHLLTTQYTNEKIKLQGVGPAVSQFLETSQILGFLKKTDLVILLEKTIRDIKAKYLPILSQGLSDRLARLEITVYINLIIRCLFAKHWPANLEIKVDLPLGKFSEEKVKSLGHHWAKVVDLKHPTIGFADASGLKAPEKEDPASNQAIDLEGLKSLKRTVSEGPNPEGPKFQRGDEVTVIRRMSWHLPQKGAAKFRKDIAEGTTGTIEGWADTEMRSVLLKVTVVICGKEQTHTQGVLPRNLKLTRDYLLEQAGAKGMSEEDPAAASSAGSGGPASSGGRNLKWAMGSSQPQDLKQEEKWTQLQHEDLLTKNFYLKGRISTGLQSLKDVLPKYNEHDFAVVHRKNEKGLWKSELWAKRDFEAYEILFAPVSSQVKDTHLMASAHACVTLPKNGRGAHPENGTCALDGRSRNMLAAKGSLDQEEHTGALYWLVSRTPDNTEVNMDMEMATWNQKIEVNLPVPKKRKAQVLEWNSAELPSYPILVNKKAIKKHTKLCVFLIEKKKDDKKDDKQSQKTLKKS